MTVKIKSMLRPSFCCLVLGVSLMMLSGCQNQEQKKTEQAELWKKSATPPGDYVAEANARRQAAEQQRAKGTANGTTVPAAPSTPR